MADPAAENCNGRADEVKDEQVIDRVVVLRTFRERA